MKCPKCASLDDKVLETRQIDDGSGLRRRRECLNCGYRFTSYEHVKEKSVMVVKRDGRREDFNVQKVINGISKAVEKRPVSQETVERLASEIEEKINAKAYSAGSMEISSAEVGNFVMDALRDIDKVAYIRFASVYIYEENEFKEKIKEVLD